MSTEYDYPEFHEQGMGCGLEDRNITDRYEAMQYGWDEAASRFTQEVVAPMNDEIARLQAEVERLKSFAEHLGDNFGELIRERDVLNSELTEAMGLLQSVIVGSGSSPAENRRYGKVREFLSSKHKPSDEVSPVAWVLVRDGEIFYEADDGIVISNTPGDETGSSIWKPVWFYQSAPAAKDWKA